MSQQKSQLRIALLQKRRDYVHSLSEQQRQEAGEKLRRNTLTLLKDKPPSVITGFWPLWDEINCRTLLNALSQKHKLGLPVVNMDKNVLEFHIWTPTSKLKPGSLKISVPATYSPLPSPDIVLTPAIAFDFAGHRLGYGRGHYDRTLEILRQKKQVLALGLGYDVQMIDSLPHQEFDQTVDIIITEKRIIQRNT
ncbi:MAG: 5-formyltetrahydrofolate cyclo-ligase [Pseudomonadota bacterium]